MKYVLWLSLLLSFYSISRENDFSGIEFNHISTKHGLSQSSVQVIFQDKSGFLWFGTQEGLNRYDGKNLKVFRHSNVIKSSLSHDVIRDIVEDKLGVLWVATNGGLNRYIEKNESFEQIDFEVENGTNTFRLNTLFVDDSGVMWIGTDGNGLYKLGQTEGNIKIEKVELFSDLNDADIRVIFEDSRGRLWVGTDRNGITLINHNRDNQKEYNNKNDFSSLSHNQIRTITEDHKGQIWIGTRGGGLNRFDELSKSFIRYNNIPNDPNSLSHDRVYKIYEDKSQRLWIATDAGLSLFQPLTDDFIRIQHHASQQSSLSHDRVLSIYQDEGGIIWFGTKSGINLWNPITAKFVHYRHLSERPNSLSHNYIHGFAEDKFSNLYIATYGGGLNYFDAKNNKFETISLSAINNEVEADKHITTLMVDDKNLMWIGTLSQGVYVYSIENKEIEQFYFESNSQNSLSSNGITSIIQDSDGEIWVATYRGGLNRLFKDSSGFSQYRLKNKELGLYNENIFQIIEDHEGYIWLATDGGGIFRLDKNINKITNFAHDPTNPLSLSGNNASSIYQDSKGRFWVGTQGYGLNRWEVENSRRAINSFKHYNVENGLNSSTVNGVIEDSQGFIWISTNKGVSRLNPDTDEIIAYNLADDIHGNELTLGAIFKTKNERLLFGGLEGISAFYPNEIKQNEHVPNIVLTKISSEGREVILNESLSKLSEIELDYKDYLVTFEFAALDFSQPSKNEYQYKLEGLYSDWVNIGNLNRATFTNLPSGNYILKVKGSNNDGVWSDESINLKVTVLPAPWATWWAFSFYSGLFCVLLILIVRSQAKRLANQEMFKSLVAEEVEEKTAVYVKNNEFLNKQMEQLKFYANVDLDTGLPNQKYLCDLVKANIQWMNQFRDINQETCQKLCFVLIRLPATGNYLAANATGVINKVAKQFSLKVDELEVDFKVAVRWSERELGVLFYCDNESECERFVGLLVKQLTEVLTNLFNQDFTQHPVKAAYSLSPFSGVKQNTISSENFLMLTEHLLHLVANDSKNNLAGVNGTCQKLNTTKFKSILDSKNLKDLNEWLILVNKN